MLHHVWRLSEAGEGNLGLSCSENGLILGRTPLIERRGDRFVVRERREIERLLARAYQNDSLVERIMPGLATVASAIDLNAATYQDAARLTYRLNAYIDQLALYDGGKMGSLEIDSSAINGRTLSLAIPKGSMTEIQRAAIDAAKARAQAFYIDFIITPF